MSPLLHLFLISVLTVLLTHAGLLHGNSTYQFFRSPTAPPKQTTQTDPTTDPTASSPSPPQVGAPVGYIPLRFEPNQNAFVVDIILGEDDPVEVKSLILDTTGEYLMIFGPAVCTTFGITGCSVPNTILPGTLENKGNFFIDSQIYRCDTCMYGTDLVTLPWTRNGSTGVFTSLKVDMIVATAMSLQGVSPDPPIYNVQPIRGLFGLGLPSSTSRPINQGTYERPFADLLSMLTSEQTSLSAPVQPTTFSYGLDLNLPYLNSSSIQQLETPYVRQTARLSTAHSRIYLSGVPPQYRESMIWSMPSTASQSGDFIASPSISYPWFSAYNVGLCNVMLYTQIPVLVDAMSPCLGVPTPMFDSLMSWLPVQCDYALTGDGNRQCWYNSINLPIPNLPALQFSLSPPGESTDSSSMSYESTLYLPLEHLLMPQGSPIVNGTPNINANFTDSQRMCITTSPGSSYITLGSIPLSAFYYHRDFESNSNGFSNKYLPANPTASQCLPRLQCIGQESSFPAYNFCYPPICSSYWFFSYNSSTRSCDLTFGFPLILALVLAIFVVLEGLFLYFEGKLDYDITHQMPKMTLIHRSESRRYRNQQTGARPSDGTAPAAAPLAGDGGMMVEEEA